MKVIIEIKNNQELKKIENYLKKRNIRIVKIHDELLDKIEDFSWEMGSKTLSRREELYDR